MTGKSNSYIKSKLKVSYNDNQEERVLKVKKFGERYD